MICCEKLSVTLNGTNRVTVREFTEYRILREIWIKVPLFVGTATVCALRLYCKNYSADIGDARQIFVSAGLADDSTHDLVYNTVSGTDLMLKRDIVSGDVMKIVTNGTTTETVEIVLYWEE